MPATRRSSRSSCSRPRWRRWPVRVRLSPWTMQPSICALQPSGLMTTPQSCAATTWVGLIAPVAVSTLAVMTTATHEELPS